MQNIIIVDNDIENAESLRKSLISKGKPYRVVEIFGNGKDALRYLQNDSTKIDFLITDICLPGFPGLELIEQMRKINRQLPCIILSAKRVFEYAIKAIELGVVRYLLKPVDTNKIMQILDSLLFRSVDTFQNDSGEKLSKEVWFMKREVEVNFRNIDMNQIADELGYSKEYLYRTFRKEMGISVNNYLQNVRLEKAKEYMAETRNYKIYEVCKLVGYEDQVYFSKLFKKKYKVLPKDFQKTKRLTTKLGSA